MLKNLQLVIVLVTVILFMAIFVPKTSAHPSCKSYGESYGYWIDCKNHQADKYFTYNTAKSMETDYVVYVTMGAARWNSTGVVSISRIYPASPDYNGYIHTYTDRNTDVVAAFYNYDHDSSGHLTKWSVRMNKTIMDKRSHEQNRITMAHEFGHAIGLNDLEASYNRNKLMYGYSNRTASSPTSKDIEGAKQILSH